MPRFRKISSQAATVANNNDNANGTTTSTTGQYFLSSAQKKTNTTTTTTNKDHNNTKPSSSYTRVTILFVLLSVFVIIVVLFTNPSSSNNSLTKKQQQRDSSLLTTPLVRNSKTQRQQQQPASSSGTSNHRNNNDNNIVVFIGIKTNAAKSIHGDRFAQIYATWLQDTVENPRVELKFFGSTSAPASSINVTQWLVPVTREVEWAKCAKRRAGMNNLCCKDQLMYQYYYEHYASSSSPKASPWTPWFCSFDDDNYVLVDNLVRVLQSYEQPSSSNNTTKLFIGRPSIGNGLTWDIHGRDQPKERVHFLTGGAGYCISRDAMMFGREKLSNLSAECAAPNQPMPDDIGIGYVINTKLGIHQQLDDHFHSHYDRVYRSIPQDEISKHVSYGYSNKKEREQMREYFPNITELFTEEEDPLMFKSLHAFLLQEKQKQQQQQQ